MKTLVAALAGAMLLIGCGRSCERSADSGGSALVSQDAHGVKRTSIQTSPEQILTFWWVRDQPSIPGKTAQVHYTSTNPKTGKTIAGGLFNAVNSDTAAARNQVLAVLFDGSNTIVVGATAALSYDNLPTVPCAAKIDQTGKIIAARSFGGDVSSVDVFGITASIKEANGDLVVLFQSGTMQQKSFEYCWACDAVTGDGNLLH